MRFKIHRSAHRHATALVTPAAAVLDCGEQAWPEDREGALIGGSVRTRTDRSWLGLLEAGHHVRRRRGHEADRVARGKERRRSPGRIKHLKGCPPDDLPAAG